MKTGYIAIIAGSLIAFFMFLAFFAIYSYNSSNTNHSGPVGAIAPMELQLENVTTEPQTITVGNTFQIYATVNNPNPWPVTYHEGCVSPLSVSFDKNVQIQTEIGCFAMSNEAINSGQSVRIHAPSTGIVYNATTIGATNATLVFTYQNQNTTFYANASKQITIEPQEHIPSSKLEDQLGLARTTKPNFKIVGSYDGLDEKTGIINIQNQTFYMTTYNGTLGPASEYTDVVFHGVNFTLFPQPQSLEISGSEFTAFVKFPDGTHEQLGLEPPMYSDMKNLTITSLTQHIHPQAGIVSHNEQIKLLVNIDNKTSGSIQLPVLSTSCDTPFVQRQSDVSTLFPNDTQITTSYTPVFFMPTNSTGNFCVHYTNSNTPSQSTVRIFEALNLSKNANDTQIFPQSVAVPTGNTNTTFTIKSGNSGFYGIGFLCGGFPLAVGYDNNSKLVKGDFPWLNQDFNCPAITYSLDFVGTRGIGTYYIPTVTHSKIDYNITGTSVSSVHLSPTIQNITFSINVQTFNDSSNFWFDIKDSDYVKFNGDPKLVEESSDPCTWIFTNDNAIPDESQWYKMTGRVAVTDRPVTFPPHTNGTYSFSILAKDLDTGYYGLDPIFYGRPTDSNVPLENMGGGSVASYYPVVIGLDKYLDPSGVCSR